MELENVEANKSSDEMPEAKRRKVSDDSEAPMDIESMKVNGNSFGALELLLKGN